MANRQVPANPVFRLDGLQRELTSGAETIELEPRSIDLLCFLVENAGRVVSRQELIDRVWQGVSVSSDAVRYAMKSLRRGLGDPAATPAFVETVARRGWRFVGSVVPVSAEVWILEGRALSDPGDTRGADFRREPFVGRDAEMGRLMELLSRVQRGDRGMGVVRGDSGIGKTRLVNTFLETASQQPDVLCARGECREHIGPGMPYSPLFEVLERIGGAIGPDEATPLFLRHAPTWLAQMPSMTEPGEREEIEAQIQGATQTRMIREWAKLIEQVAHDRTLVIAIEDLQWADPSTLDTLLFAARRAEKARVLLLITLRSTSTDSSTRALQHGIEDAMNRTDVEQLTLGAFDIGSTRAYLGARFGKDEAPCHSDALCEDLVSASTGNPLFLTSLVDECVKEGLIREQGPRWEVSPTRRLESVSLRLKPLIERQIRSLRADLGDLLDVASLIETEFSAAVLATALERAIDDVEADCDELVDDGRFVEGSGAMVWPDGTVSSSYRFKHALHRDVLFERLSPGRRARLSRAIGERLRVAFAGHEDDVAAKLALHFERGLEFYSAAKFQARAGEASATRFANIEAASHFRKTLDLLSRSDEEDLQLLEIRTRLALCAPLAATEGYASEELERNLRQLEALTADLEDSIEMFPAILGLWSLHFVRADFERTGGAGDRMLALAKRASSPLVRLQAHQSAGHALFYQGRVLEAQHHYEMAVEGYDPDAHERQDYSVGDDPLVLVLTCRCLSSWFLGYTDRAIASAEEAVRQGERLEHPPSLALALTYGAVLHQLRGDVDRAWEWSDRSLELTSAEGIVLWFELSRIVKGWSIAQSDGPNASDGVDLIRAGIAGWQATGSRLGTPHFLTLLAVSLANVGEIDEALSTLAMAERLSNETGQGLFRSEIHRCRGDVLCLRAQSAGGTSALAAAREDYQRAGEEAEARGLRANTLQSWSALVDIDPEAREAWRRLADVVASYPAGTAADLDLARARGLLDHME